DGEPARLGGGQVLARVAFRIDHQRPAVAEVYQVGGVPKTLVDQGKRDREGMHCRSQGWLTPTGDAGVPALAAIAGLPVWRYGSSSAYRVCLSSGRLSI